jgi:hypothetical protein
MRDNWLSNRVFKSYDLVPWPITSFFVVRHISAPGRSGTDRGLTSSGVFANFGEQGPGGCEASLHRRRSQRRAPWPPLQRSVLGRGAYALDGDKNKVLTVASNAGHCLWSGIVPPERAKKVVDRLMARGVGH